MSKPDGGAAFPRAAFAPADVTHEDVGIHDSQEGMSLRAWLAGQAMIALAPKLAITVYDQGASNKDFAKLAQVSCQVADALIAELNKSE